MKHVTAIREVTAVTTVGWAAYKALKVAQPGGCNGSTGVAMTGGMFTASWFTR